MAIKRTCKGCFLNAWNTEYKKTCILGYDIETIINKEIQEVYGQNIYTYKPLEECPKPKTQSKFEECKELNYFKGYNFP